MNTKIGNVFDEVKNCAIIPHVCSTNGSFDTAIAKQINRLYPEVKQSYQKIEKYEVGEIQPVRVASRLIIVNMICMEGVYSETNLRPLALHHLKTCLEKVREFARNMDLPVHIPNIINVPKGELEIVSNIISQTSSSFTVWQLPKKEVAEPKEPVNINTNKLLDHGTTNRSSFRLPGEKTNRRGY